MSYTARAPYYGTPRARALLDVEGLGAGGLVGSLEAPFRGSDPYEGSPRLACFTLGFGLGFRVLGFWVECPSSAAKTFAEL